MGDTKLPASWTEDDNMRSKLPEPHPPTITTISPLLPPGLIKEVQSSAPSPHMNHYWCLTSLSLKLLTFSSKATWAHTSVLPPSFQFHFKLSSTSHWSRSVFVPPGSLEADTASQVQICKQVPTYWLMMMTVIKRKKMKSFIFGSEKRQTHIDQFHPCSFTRSS